MSDAGAGADRAGAHEPLRSDPPTAPPRSPRPAVFLDRDGVLNEGVPDPWSGLIESPLRPEQVRLVPGAAPAARRLADAGFALVCVSNQPAAAKGRVSLESVLAVHRRVLELLAAEQVVLDAWRLCPDHPDGVVAELAGQCDCRKPAPGMLLDAAREQHLVLARSWMIGDSDTDVEAGRRAGARTVLVAYPGSSHKRSAGMPADLHAADLAEAADLLLSAPRDDAAS